MEAVDELIALHQPHDFQAVGQFYRQLDQTSDAEVCALMAQHGDTGEVSEQ